MKKKNVFSGFDGISTGRYVLEELGIEVDNYYAAEIDKKAISISKYNYPDIKQMGDITKWKEWDIDWKTIDLIIGGSPCFVKDTQILTKQGYKNIQDVQVLDEVLTHTGNWRKVLKVGGKLNTPTRIIKGFGNPGLETTDEHPFYSRTKTFTSKKKKLISEPEWIEAKKIDTNTYCSHVAFTPNESKKDDLQFWYMMGRYTVDGWYRKTKRKHRKNSYMYSFIICCGKHEFKSLKNHFDKFGYNYNYTEDKSVYKFKISSQKLVEFVEKIGKGASNKIIHPELWQQSTNNIKSFLQGYFESDGYFNNSVNLQTSSSVSSNLSLGIQQLITTVYKVPVRYTINKRSPTCVIEGTTVNQKDSHVIAFKKDKRKQDRAFFEGIHSWLPVQSNTSTGTSQTVYNLEVEIDNSYTANNIVVHNCTNLSSAGNRLGLEGLESKLFYTYYDIFQHIKSLNPDVKFLLENVKMELKWENIMSDMMGCKPIKVNSNICSAQNRERLYWTNIPFKGFKENDVQLSSILEPIENVSDNLYIIKGDNLIYTDIQPARITGRKIRDEEVRPELEEGKKTVQVLGVTSKNPTKSNCLTTVTKDNFVTNLPRGQYTYIYKTKDEVLEKHPNSFVRYFTPIELERLQTLPDDYTKYGTEYRTSKKVDVTTEISYSKRAEVLGNGWTANIIISLLEGLK